MCFRLVLHLRDFAVQLDRPILGPRESAVLTLVNPAGPIVLLFPFRALAAGRAQQRAVFQLQRLVLLALHTLRRGVIIAVPSREVALVL